MSIPLPVIEARGTYREIGRALGEGGREQIRRSLAFHEEKYEWLAGLPFARAEERALGLLRTRSVCFPSTSTSSKAWPRERACRSPSSWCSTAARSSCAFPM